MELRHAAVINFSISSPFEPVALTTNASDDWKQTSWTGLWTTDVSRDKARSPRLLSDRALL